MQAIILDIGNTIVNFNKSEYILGIKSHIYKIIVIIWSLVSLR